MKKSGYLILSSLLSLLMISPLSVAATGLQPQGSDQARKEERRKPSPAAPTRNNGGGNGSKRTAPSDKSKNVGSPKRVTPTTPPANKNTQKREPTQRPGNRETPKKEVKPTTPTKNNDRNRTPGNQPGNRKEPQPGNNMGKQPGNRPGSNPGNHRGDPGKQPGNRPGQNPGHNPGQRPHNPPSTHPGNHPPYNGYRNPGAPFRPHVNRPHVHYRQPGYRPPRPGGGFIPVPPPNRYRPVFFLPAPPPPPVYISYRVPTLGAFLGLTFGTFIDNSINALYNNGYNVLGYENNIVYVSNVKELGEKWPEAAIYYTDGLMSDIEFQYWTKKPNTGRYDKIYKKLCKSYGQPVSVSIENGFTVANWWAGSNTGFVTLQYGPATNNYGEINYYTMLIYSDHS